MQITIDISEDVYTRLFDNGIQDNEIAVDDVCEMARAIRLGTPLPKQEAVIDTQNEKTGWHIAHGMYEDRFWCSCGYIKVMDSSMAEWKYCPICGAKMQEVV